MVGDSGLTTMQSQSEIHNLRLWLSISYSLLGGTERQFLTLKVFDSNRLQLGLLQCTFNSIHYPRRSAGDLFHTAGGKLVEILRETSGKEDQLRIPECPLATSGSPQLTLSGQVGFIFQSCVVASLHLRKKCLSLLPASYNKLTSS